MTKHQLDYFVGKYVTIEIPNSCAMGKLKAIDYPFMILSLFLTRKSFSNGSLTIENNGRKNISLMPMFGIEEMTDEEYQHYKNNEYFKPLPSEYGVPATYEKK